MKILIVDDNQDSRMILMNMLKSAGHVVEAAIQGEDALQKARQFTPELLISDILMPVMDGFKLCSEVKKDATLKAIPFVFYTATYVDPADERLALSLGASRYILKPMENDEFLRSIDEVVQEAREGALPVPEKLLKDEEKLRVMREKRVGIKLDKKIEELADTKNKFKKIERSYKNLFNSIRDVIIVADLDRMIIDVNQPALRALFGYELDEIKGKKPGYCMRMTRATS